jgi:hypothetical protein
MHRVKVQLIMLTTSRGTGVCILVPRHKERNIPLCACVTSKCPPRVNFHTEITFAFSCVKQKSLYFHYTLITAGKVHSTESRYIDPNNHCFIFHYLLQLAAKHSILLLSFFIIATVFFFPLYEH